MGSEMCIRDRFKDSITNSIILDPQAPIPVSRSEILNADIVVIGGIMGDYPPRGRTKELISRKVEGKGAKIRNLGKEQFTIAGAAYIIKAIEDGAELKDIEIVKGLNITIDLKHGIKFEVYLPYAFPAKNGKPIIPEDYIEVIIRRTPVYEQQMLLRSIECYPT